MNRENPATDLALIAVFTALIAAVTVFVPGFSVAGSSVPITLQTLCIGLCGMVLGPVRGFLATLLYLVIGFAGIPVFAQGRSGLGVLRGGSAGYLVAFPIYALVVGALSYWAIRRLRHKGVAMQVAALFVAGLVGSLLVVHPLGIVGMATNIANFSYSKAWKADIVYWPGDIMKTAAAAFVAVAVHRAFPWLSLGRTVGQSAR